MSAVSRMAGPRGARFFDNGDDLAFVLVLDGNTRFGPRKATDDDIAEHAEAYRRYVADRAAQEADRPLDDYPGQPPIQAIDPPGGPPTPEPPRARGGVASR